MAGTAAGPADPGHLFGSSATSRKAPGRNFKVVIRVRPMLEREGGTASCVNVTSKHAITIRKPQDFVSASGRPMTAGGRSGADEMHFAYDRVFGEESDQVEIYQQSCKPIVLSVLEGYNGTILAYGQTGTGKTYTMEGAVDGDNRGIIPRAANEIFEYIQADKPNGAAVDAGGKQSQWLVRCSFLQIYNEKVSDLLKPDSKEDLKIREKGVGKEVYVEGLSETVVRTPADIHNLLNKGRAQRHTNSTKMNQASSRSHAVFTIIVEHSLQDPSVDDFSDVTVGKLHLVDLAGSERYGVSDEEKRHRETIDINRSLSAFGKVVLALTSKGTQHIPYRDSKLTRLLQDSLGGNSKTTMISTVTTSTVSYLESATTLKFANCAKSVKNVAQVNNDVSESAMLTAMQEQIKQLEAALAQKEVAAGPDEAELKALQAHRKRSQIEKSVIVSELAKRQREVQAAQRERETFLKQINDLQGQLVAGGTQIQETAEFKEAVAKERSRLEEEHDAHRSEIAAERRKLEEEKARFEEERRSFAELARSAKIQAVAAFGSTRSSTSTSDESGEISSPTPPLQPRPPSTPQPRPPSSTPGPDRHRRRASRESVSPEAAGGGGGGGGAVAAASATASPPRNARGRRWGRSMSATMASDLQLSDVSSDEEDPPPRAGSDSSEAAADGGGRRRMFQRRNTASILQRAASPEGDLQDRVADARDTRSEEEEAVDKYTRALQHPETGIPLCSRRVRFTTVKLCFSGSEAASWFLANMDGVDTQEAAKRTGQQLVDLGVIIHYKSLKTFVVSDVDLYQFRNMSKLLESGGGNQRPGTASGRLRRGSATSVSRSSIASSRTSLARSSWNSRLSVSSIRSDNSLASLAMGLQQGAGGSFEEYADDSSSPLHIAAARGEVGAIRALLSELGVDELDGSGRTPLMYAVIGNRFKACKVLVKCKADVNARDDNGNTPLMWAACRGCSESMKELLKLGADVSLADNSGRTSIHWATKLNRMDCLEYLLRCAYRAVVNKRDDEMLTALHWAVMCDHAQHVEALIKAQADPLIGDSDGRNPMHYAVSQSAMTALAVLTDLCPQIVNAPDEAGRTALHTACAEGSLEVAHTLLNTPSIDVNAADRRGTTPLHWAAVCNRVEMCSLLLQRGARLMARDSAGLTPLHYATEKGHVDCANVMQRVGGSAAARRPSLGGSVAPPQYGSVVETATQRGRSVARSRVPSGRDMWAGRPGERAIDEPPAYGDSPKQPRRSSGE